MTTSRSADVAARIIDGVKTFGEGGAAVRALDGVSAEFEKGRFNAIMGPSGSGKSTLMHCIAGLDSLTEGQVFLGDVDLGTLSDRDLTMLRRDHVGFVFQAFNLVPTLNAEENILLPLSIAGKDPDADWFAEVIDAVGIEDRLSHLPSELSGGQQQRVAAARALVSRPRIIFADEPSGNLDSKSSTELLDFIRMAVDDLGQTIVMVTHDASAASRADSIVFLDDGRIVSQMHNPTTESVLDRLKELGAE